MREIKFRAWHTILKCYLGESHGWNNYGPNLCDGKIESENCILEQFTGLHDKTGKEIYEGDILHTNEADWIAKVIWNYDGFMLTGLNNSGFSCDPDYDQCEVIGNIHESPELIPPSV